MGRDRHRDRHRRTVGGGARRVVTPLGARRPSFLNHPSLAVSAVQPLPVSCLRALRELPLEFLGLGWTSIRYDAETADLAALKALWPKAEVLWWPHERRR